MRPHGLNTEESRPENDLDGTVIRVLERRRAQIVGTLQRGRKFLSVKPDDPRIPHDIYVTEPRDVGRPALDGDKVVVELGDWVSRESNPEGEIIEVLGAPDAGVAWTCFLCFGNMTFHFISRKKCSTKRT